MVIVLVCFPDMILSLFTRCILFRSVEKWVQYLLTLSGTVYCSGTKDTR